MASIPCPLAGCSSNHELRTARNRRGTPFVVCPQFGGSTIFLRGDLGEKWLARNGGAKPNPADESPEDQDEIEGASSSAPSQRTSPENVFENYGSGPYERVNLVVCCDACGAECKTGQESCENCGEKLNWEDQHLKL